MRSRFTLLAVFLAICACNAVLAQDESWAGRGLAEYLEALNDRGLRIIYSSDLVGEDLVLETTPDAGNPLAGLADVLEPFGLVAVPGPAGSLLITAAEAREDGTVAEALVDEPTPIPEIVVTSSLHRLEYAAPSGHTYLDRELATRIPLTAEEAVRMTHRLPGTASGGVSSRSHIRGGEVNEVLFLFDGLRLYEPYHLKDFQAIASIVNSNAIGSIDFYSGAYPVQYGDRMSGVMNIDLREPAGPAETEIALSFFNASVLSIGTFGAQAQGDWLVTARRGNLDLVIDVMDPDFGSPDYQDYLAHVGWEFGPRARISANVLVSDDKISLSDDDRGERAKGSYSNRVFWARWQADWSSRLKSDTIVAVSNITDRRSGSLALPGIVSGTLSDTGEFRALEFRQDWSWIASDSWMLRFGVNLKDLDAEYRLSSQKTVEVPFSAILDNEPVTVRDFQVSPSGAQYAAYSELRWRLAEKWVLDYGLRWDQQNYTTAQDDKQYSPRASLLYQHGRRTELRFGWGQYYQAQEINELQISDGVTDFFPAQRAEHFVLSLQHGFENGVELGLSVYRKSFRSIRPRFENSFNTLTLLPELQFDRILVDAGRAEAVGAEIMLTRGSATDDVLWWLGYAWSEVEDETAAGDFQRSWDQTHTFKAGLSRQWSGWDLSVAAEVHTGWPKTTLTGTLVPGAGGNDELVLAVSPRNGSRYAYFHTLDARIAREFDVGRGVLTAFLEVTNLYDARNPCCVEYSLNDDGSLASRQGHWLPLLPSLGVLWQF